MEQNTDALIEEQGVPAQAVVEKKTPKKYKVFLAFFVVIVVVLVGAAVAGLYFINATETGKKSVKPSVQNQLHSEDQQQALLNLMQPVKTSPVTPASIKSKALRDAQPSSIDDIGQENKSIDEVPSQNGQIVLPNQKSNQAAIFNLQQLVAKIGSQQEEQSKRIESLQSNVTQAIAQLKQPHSTSLDPEKYVALRNSLSDVSKKLHLIERKVEAIDLTKKIQTTKEKKDLKPPFSVESIGVWNNRLNIIVSMNDRIKVLYTDDVYEGWKVVSINQSLQQVELSSPDLNKPLMIQVGD